MLLLSLDLQIWMAVQHDAIQLCQTAFNEFIHLKKHC